MTTSDGKSPRIFGIDLGTTYSCISYIDERGIPVVIPSERQSFVTPSVVYYEADDQVIVGEDAKQEMKRNPVYGIELVKQNMGEMVENALGENVAWSIPVNGKERKAEEISAGIFRFCQTRCYSNRRRARWFQCP